MHLVESPDLCSGELDSNFLPVIARVRPCPKDRHGRLRAFDCRQGGDADPV